MSNSNFHGLKKQSVNVPVLQTDSLVAQEVNQFSDVKVVVGYAPTGFLGSTSIMAFNQNPGQVPATVGSNAQALKLPANIRLESATVTNNGVAITPLSAAFDVGTAATPVALGENIFNNTPSLWVNTPVGSSVVSGYTGFLNQPGFTGTYIAASSYVTLQSSQSLTTGDMKIYIKYSVL